MKTFHQFITEVYDKDVMGRSQITKQGEGGRVGAKRKKTEPEKKRVKAVGGGKTAPAKDYKPRKDIGTQKPRSQREQQPTKERGSAGLSPREQQRKAAQERRAAKSGAKTKSADELLRTKAKKTVDPKYKPVKASGKTEKERKALYKKGERTLRDIRLKNLGKKSEKELKFKVTSK
mgnify:CR=1 FL=1|tara:strand:- start:634 stop:1161 length:528 start_codon:yes stop_codon:yes gene_type:complete